MPEAARRPWVRAACALLLASVCAAALLVARGHADGPPDTGAALAGRAGALADTVVTRFAAAQRPDGSFPDPVVADGSDYGTAMLGLAMLRRGSEARDARQLESGIRALQQAAAAPTLGAFELLALARAYRWGEAHLASEPFASGPWASARDAVAAALASRGLLNANPAVVACLRDPGCYGNQKLVATVATQALLATGLRGTRLQALLADPAGLQAFVDRTAAQIPGQVGDAVTEPGLTGGGLLSDPPRNPLAYHALSVYLLGALLDDAGPTAGRALTAAWERAAIALVALAAPDGDLSYYGRGQGQVWVPAVTVAAAARLAATTGDAVLARRALTVAGAALARLETGHRGGPYGLTLVPGAPTAAALTGRALDHYASTRTYDGLAVQALDDAAPWLERAPDAAAAPSVLGRGVTTTGGQTGLVTLGRAGTWAAVAVDDRNAHDARYGPGLLVVRTSAGDDRWTDAVPAAPYATSPDPTVALELGGVRHLPDGEPARAVGEAAAESTGRWRSAGGAALPGRTTWRWSITAGGAIELRFTVPVTARLVVRTRRTAAAAGVRTDVVLSGAADHGAAVLRPDGASAYESQLRVEERTVAVRAGTPVRLRFTPRR